VNKAHLEYCSSPEWARLVEDELLPWVLDGCELGDDLLEVGPGPGLTTDVLRHQAARLTALELDRDLAAQLAARLAGSNVTVVAGDVTRMPFPAGRFSAAACLTMLHHIPSPALQDAALAELARVLRPGGLLVGADGLDTPARRELHVDDVFVPVEAATLAARLEAAGFGRPRVDIAGDRVRFAAIKTFLYRTGLRTRPAIPATHCGRTGLRTRPAIPSPPAAAGALAAVTPFVPSGRRQPERPGRPARPPSPRGRLVRARLHRGLVEQLALGDLAAGRDRLGPALGHRADQLGR
jgi:SAM-dependent methyltransferase